MSPDARNVRALDIIVWHVQRALSMGFMQDALLSALSDRPYLHTVVVDIIKGDLLHGRPPPAFMPGEAVEVILNERNRTYRCGRVDYPIWHDKDRRWYFLLRIDGKIFKKRYFADDLRPLPGADRLE